MSPFVGRLVATMLVMVASCGGGDRPPAERFVVEGDGVSDSKTGLEWTSRDADQALSWDGAERHCRDLDLNGRTDWRLPDIEELQELYDQRFATPCGDQTCHLDPRIHIGSQYVWTATERMPGTRFYLDFSLGSLLSPWIGSPGLVRRALCVRGRAR